MSKPGPPKFENLFLQSLADAIAKRRKALSYHADDFTLERSRDEKGEVEFERLNLAMNFRPWTSLHFTAWEDSMGWVSMRQIQRKVGWTFVVEFHTELWGVEPEEIVRRIRATMVLRPFSIRRATSEDEEGIKQVWATVEAPKGKGKRKRR
jgi:hypothetical protein